MLEKADDVANHVRFGIDQSDVTAYGHIAVIAWRGWQLTPQIRRHGMTPPSKILRQYFARLQTRLLLG